MKVVAISDLGGLGDKTGTLASVVVPPGSSAPVLLPWLILLGLMFLGANRCGRAWLICLPLAAVLAASAVVRAALAFLSPEGTDVFLRSYQALGYALAAAWLLMPLLGARARGARFFGSLVTIALGTLLFGVAQDGLGSDPGYLICLALLGGIAAAGGGLAAICRRPSQPASRLLIWVPFWLLVLWLGIVVPFSVIGLTSGDPGAVMEVLRGILTFAACTFLVFVPFLLLSLLDPFYRDRLRVFLGQSSLRETEAPPILAEGSPATPTTKRTT